MTPMSKQNIQAMFTQLTQSTQSFTNKIELNKSPHGAEVTSDFIRIYQNDKNKKSDSFAFAFTYRNTQGDVNQSQVIVSIMKEEVYESSKSLSLKEFETLFKCFTKEIIDEQKLNYLITTEKLRTYFGINKENNLDFAKLTNTIVEIETNFKEQIEDAEKECNAATNALVELEDAIRKKVNAYKAQVEKEMNHCDFVKAMQAASSKRKVIQNNEKDLIIDVAAKEIEKYPSLRRTKFIKNLEASMVKNGKVSPRLKSALVSHHWMNEFPNKK